MLSLRGTIFSLRGTIFSLRGRLSELRGTIFSLRGRLSELRGTCSGLRGHGFQGVAQLVGRYECMRERSGLPPFRGTVSTQRYVAVSSDDLRPCSADTTYLAYLTR
jgi:hypothetical protein